MANTDVHTASIGGIGPGATGYDYQGLIRSLAADGRKLTLTIAEFETPHGLGPGQTG